VVKKSFAAAPIRAQSDDAGQVGLPGVSPSFGDMYRATFATQAIGFLILAFCSLARSRNRWTQFMMLRHRLRSGLASRQFAANVAALAISVCFAWAGNVQPAAAYTPESPEVRELLDRALKYLDSAETHSRLGGKSLIGLALIKGNRPTDHPKVVEAVEACKRAAANLEERHAADVIYDLGIAIIFLCELDADQYRQEITALMKLLNKWQKDFGGWGYLEGANLTSGDTSMTQYGVLATWTADRTGAYPVDAEVGAKVANWLMRTQDPSGGWGYQGVDPGEFRRVQQNGVQHSLSAAGCGSLYVIGDVLRLTSGMKAGGQDDGLPPAIKVVREQGKTPTQGPVTAKVDPGRMRNALQDGDRWFDARFQIDPPEWVYYYLYALERYKSFRELTLGREEKEPAWYNEGVEFLRQSQSNMGSWDRDSGPSVDTAFGILFLVRGTKKSIQKAEAYSGRLRGGRGLPTNAGEVTVGEDGRIVKTPFQGKAETLLSILEAAGSEDLDALGQDFEITLSNDAAQRQRELERLRRLVTAEDFAVRMAAIKALYNLRDLNDVPIFIYALGDPDPRIVRKARDALRLISRKIDGFGLEDDPSEGAKLEAIQRWKQWYLGIRPDAQFLK
jgi:hypothetical protein